MSQAPTRDRRAPRLGMLDALRFVAAIAVVSVHFTSQQNPGWGGPVPTEMEPVARVTMYGTLGVPLFFIISGFVLLMTAWDRDVPTFVASRVGRLFPAYWVAVAFSAVLVLWVWPGNLAYYDRAFTKTEVGVNLTMVQDIFRINDLDGPYWTLMYEAKFYLLIALFMLIGINRRRVLAFATLWPVLANLAQNTGQDFIAALLMPDYSPFFAGGMLLYLIYRDGHDLGTWLLVTFQVLLGANFASGHYMTLSEGTPGFPRMGVLALLTVGCFVAVAAVTLTPLTRWNAGWMTALGALTYPLYLIHENLGWYVIHLLRGSFGPWVVVAVAAVVVLAAAALIHYLVERPVGARLRAAVVRMLEKTTTDESESAPSPAAAQPADATAGGQPESAAPPSQRLSDATLVLRAHAGVPPHGHPSGARRRPPSRGGEGTTTRSGADRTPAPAGTGGPGPRG